MKPGDHPEFYRLPPPPGRSRESTIVLDEQGRFWHDDELISHQGMAQAFASWIGRHPEDGRYILDNGYDWSYFTVKDVPYFVLGLATGAELPELRLSDGTREPLDPESLSVAQDDVVYVTVKAGAFRARFSPQAQTALEPFLVPGSGDLPDLQVAGRRYPIARQPAK